jgi:hypothetical protein
MLPILRDDFADAQAGLESECPGACLASGAVRSNAPFTRSQVKGSVIIRLSAVNSETFKDHSRSARSGRIRK